MFADDLVYEELKKTQCREGCNDQQLKNALIYPPKFTTLRVNTLRYTTREVMELVKSLVTKGYENRSSVVLPKIFQHPVLSDVIVIESTGKMDVEPCDGKEVIVGVQCAASVLRGAEIYCAGIVGCPQSLAKGDRVAVYADLRGKCLRGFCDPFLGSRLFIGNGSALLSRSELFGPQTPRGIGLALDERIFDCPSLNDSELNDIGFLQNLPSILVGHVLDPKPGEVILDMCAAPGGKTTHIATLMNNEGHVVALDKTNRKINEITENCLRLGVTNVKAYAFNAVNAHCTSVDHSLSPPFHSEAFDRILLDAPCSALGQRPQLFNNLRLKELGSYPKLQKKLFATAVELLKKQGRLVYSTCTTTFEENENMVIWALNRFSSLKLVGSIPRLSDSALLHQHELQNQCLHCQRFFMSNTEDSCNLDSIGFFIACFEKI